MYAVVVTMALMEVVEVLQKRLLKFGEVKKAARKRNAETKTCQAR
jgi:hypothetical protein